MPLSIASSHSLHPDDQSGVQHGFSGHVIPLSRVLGLHDVVSILNVNITFIRSTQSKLDVTLFFFGLMAQWPMALVLVSHDATGISISVT